MHAPRARAFSLRSLHCEGVVGEEVVPGFGMEETAQGAEEFEVLHRLTVPAGAVVVSWFAGA